MNGGNMQNDEMTKAPSRTRAVQLAFQNLGDSFISKKEVAARLGKTARTIEHWMQRGVIPYLKLGRGRRATVLFKWADIEAHLKSNFSGGSRHE
jgi:excisionase family DNA binding protein